MTTSQEFRLEDYKAIRKEIELYLTQLRSEERYVVIAMGAIWAALIFHNLTAGLLWLSPMALLLGFAARLWSINRHFINTAEYIHKTEDHFGVDGWEHFLTAKRKVSADNRWLRWFPFRTWTLGVGIAIWWVGLVVLTGIGYHQRFNLAGKQSDDISVKVVVSAPTQSK